MSSLAHASINEQNPPGLLVLSIDLYISCQEKVVEINKIGSQSRRDVPTVTCWYKNAPAVLLLDSSAIGVVLDKSFDFRDLLLYMVLLILGTGPTMIMNWAIASGCSHY